MKYKPREFTFLDQEKKMALINCPDCESQVSSRAHACPKCGYPIDQLTSFSQAIVLNDIEMTRDLLRAGFSVDVLDELSQTPLMIASRQGSKQIVELLIQSGADVNKQNDSGRTALMEAISGGHQKIVELLMESEADLNLKTRTGSTALDIAVQKNKINVIPILRTALGEPEGPPELPVEAIPVIADEIEPPPAPAKPKIQITPPPLLDEELVEEKQYDEPGLICRTCKHQIAAEEIWCSNCKAPIIRRYCPGCKNLIPENAARCPYCSSEKVGHFRYIRHLEQFIATTVVIGVLIFLFGIYLPKRPTSEVSLTPKSEASTNTSAEKSSIPAKNEFRSKGVVLHAISNSYKNDTQPTVKKVAGVAVPNFLNQNQEPDSEFESATRSTGAPKVEPEKEINESDDTESLQPESESWYTKAQQLNNDGFELMKQGRYTDAIPVLARSLRSFPPDAKRNLTYAYALFNLGKSLRLAGRPDLAIPILEERLKFSDQRQVVLEELEQAHRDLGTPEEVYQ
jgi:RNA polymerase subunit RPABC4/transcription elongation factor Spt4